MAEHEAHKLAEDIKQIPSWVWLGGAAAVGLLWVLSRGKSSGSGQAAVPVPVGTGGTSDSGGTPAPFFAPWVTTPTGPLTPTMPTVPGNAPTLQQNTPSGLLNIFTATQNGSLADQLAFVTTYSGNQATGYQVLQGGSWQTMNADQFGAFVGNWQKSFSGSGYQTYSTGLNYTGAGTYNYQVAPGQSYSVVVPGSTPAPTSAAATAERFTRPPRPPYQPPFLSPTASPAPGPTGHISQKIRGNA